MADMVTSSWSQPALPLAMEIYERIIDRIDLNPFPTLPTDNVLERATLAACSLTCRAWAPRSRMHIFGNITLKDSNYRNFVSLVRQSSIIRHLVRHCQIKIATCDPRRYDGKSAPSCSITSLVLICLKWLPALQGLTIHFPLDGSFLSREHHMLPQILKQLPPIKSLRLCVDSSSRNEDRDAPMCSFNKLIDLISNFPHLINLDLTDWDIDCSALGEKKFLQSPFLKARMSLTVLHMRCTFDSCAFIEHSMRAGTFKTEGLQELHLILVSEPGDNTINAFVYVVLRKLIPPSLRELSLEFTRKYNAPPPHKIEWPSMGGLCPIGLQRLYITCANMSLLSIVYAISHNPQLSEISISYVWYPYDAKWEYRTSDLGHFGILDFQLLNRALFPSLKKVTFQEKMWDQDSQTIVESKREPSDLMPNLYESGILHCHTPVITKPDIFLGAFT